MAAVSAWILAWYATASPTVLTDQTRVWDVFDATAPACWPLAVSTAVSAPRMVRSVNQQMCRCCFTALSPSESLYHHLVKCFKVFPAMLYDVFLLSSSQRCYCSAGFRLHPNAVSCLDINECSSTPHAVCKHTCTNTPGSYTCQCYPGFYLEPDNKSCKTKGETKGFLNSRCTGPV